MGLRPAEDLENVTGRNATWMDRMDYILDIQWGLYIYIYIHSYTYIYTHTFIYTGYRRYRNTTISKSKYLIEWIYIYILGF